MRGAVPIGSPKGGRIVERAPRDNTCLPASSLNTSSTERYSGQIEAIMREDPFCALRLADFRVTELRASQLASDMPKRVKA